MSIINGNNIIKTKKTEDIKAEISGKGMNISGIYCAVSVGERNIKLMTPARRIRQKTISLKEKIYALYELLFLSP